MKRSPAPVGLVTTHRPHRVQGARMALLGLGVAALLAGCGEYPRAPDRSQAALITGGDPQRGREKIRDYGCGACHTIPGVRGANTRVGPPLSGMASRMFVAGLLANNPENMVLWIRHPTAVDPRTAMPDVGVTESDARDIAAYLYTLK